MRFPDLAAEAARVTAPIYPDLADAALPDLLGVIGAAPRGVAEYRAVAREASQQAVPQMPYRRPVEGAGGLWVVRRKGGTTVWDDRAVAHAVADAAVAADRVHHPRDVADAVVAAGRIYWRVTALVQLGLNPDDYRDVTPGELEVVSA